MRSWNDAVIEAVKAGATADEIRREITKTPVRACSVVVDGPACVALIELGWTRESGHEARVAVDPASSPYDSRLCGLGA